MSVRRRPLKCDMFIIWNGTLFLTRGHVLPKKYGKKLFSVKMYIEVNSISCNEKIAIENCTVFLILGFYFYRIMQLKYLAFVFTYEFFKNALCGNCIFIALDKFCLSNNYFTWNKWPKFRLKLNAIIIEKSNTNSCPVIVCLNFSN